jgi:hypothetical protein
MGHALSSVSESIHVVATVMKNAVTISTLSLIRTLFCREIRLRLADSFDVNFHQLPRDLFFIA